MRLCMLLSGQAPFDTNAAPGRPPAMQTKQSPQETRPRFEKGRLAITDSSSSFMLSSSSKSLKPG